MHANSRQTVGRPASLGGWAVRRCLVNSFSSANVLKQLSSGQMRPRRQRCEVHTHHLIRPQHLQVDLDTQGALHPHGQPHHVVEGFVSRIRLTGTLHQGLQPKGMPAGRSEHPHQFLPAQAPPWQTSSCGQVHRLASPSPRQ